MVRRIGMKLVALAVLCGLMLGAVPSACAIKQTLMYFSAASGTQNTESVAPGIGKGEGPPILSSHGDALEEAKITNVSGLLEV